MVMKKISKKRITTKYRSKYEERLSNVLINAGYKYEPIKLKYTIPESIHTYTPDFVLGNKLIELKGLWDSTDRKKILYIHSQYPQYELIMVFQNENLKIYKGSKTTYADFCNKNNIKWINHKQLRSILNG